MSADDREHYVDGLHDDIAALESANAALAAEVAKYREALTEIVALDCCVTSMLIAGRALDARVDAASGGGR